MTPQRFKECLDAIGWTGRELARRLEMDECQVRRWASGAEMPQRVADWLETLARAYESKPPPIRRAPPRAVPRPKIEWDAAYLPPADRVTEIEAAIYDNWLINEIGALSSLFSGRIPLEGDDYVIASRGINKLVLGCEYHSKSQP